MTMANASRSSDAARMYLDRHPGLNKSIPAMNSPCTAGRLNGNYTKRSSHKVDDGAVSGRVRVAVRLRPRNTEELKEDADFADCVELEPELRRLKLRKNNWDSDTFQFDEVLTEHASQKRVYEVVAKPVVESVLEGYNGTIMAYGQTGTGKTYTLGRLDEEDESNRGIMVRAMEDILAGISLETDSVVVSYLQLYMEMIQDLLAPEKENIPIVEDQKAKDVLVPRASVVEIKDQKSFVELLKAGEANRAVANTKLNTESSRSHAILMVNVRKAVGQDETTFANSESTAFGSIEYSAPTIRRSKLLVVDLAGSERIDKSGVGGFSLEEAKSINLSLTALGKCINALAEASPHVPIRDSKLTRLLRDSFGGTARTSLVITIGPSPRHRAETSSTIMFGQRAMKVENMVKLKEEYDYKSLCRRLEKEIDKLLIDNERQTKALLGAEDMERRLEEIVATEKLKHEKDILEVSTSLKKVQTENQRMEDELRSCHEELCIQKERLNEESKQRERLQVENNLLKEKLYQLQCEVDEMNKRFDQMRRHANKSDKPVTIQKLCHSKDGLKGQKSTIVKLFEQVGLENLLTLLVSADDDVRIHALKVIANLAADEKNQEKIVEAGGLQLLLNILESPIDEAARRVASGAIANLAMNELNQVAMVSHGAVGLLARTVEAAEEPQTLSMVAGAIANLCGNRDLLLKLRDEGGIRALLQMAEAANLDIQAQVARGIANYAKCESRGVLAGAKRKSFLIESGALPWIVTNADSKFAAIKRHVELALCHLAQNELNVEEMAAGGALQKLSCISMDASCREDIRELAQRGITAINARCNQYPASSSASA